MGTSYSVAFLRTFSQSLMEDWLRLLDRPVEWRKNFRLHENHVNAWTLHALLLSALGSASAPNLVQQTLPATKLVMTEDSAAAFAVADCSAWKALAVALSRSGGCQHRLPNRWQRCPADHGYFKKEANLRFTLIGTKCICAAPCKVIYCE